MGSVLDIGPDSPLVFPKSKGSSTQIGPANILLSNSTFRCLDTEQLDLLALKLGASEGDSELRNGLHPAWWVLIAAASVGKAPVP